MKPGDLVQFTATPYRPWGIGMVLGEHVFQSKWRGERGYFDVLTGDGVKIVSYHFLEVISEAW